MRIPKCLLLTLIIILGCLGYHLADQEFSKEVDVKKVNFRQFFSSHSLRHQALGGKEARVALSSPGPELKEEGMADPALTQPPIPVEIQRYVLFSRKPLQELRFIKKQTFDLNQDGNYEDYSLDDGSLMVEVSGQAIWESPVNWWVSDFALGDSTNDGTFNLNLSVWKEGSFGESKPFWVTGEDKSFKNHLFIYKLVDWSFKPVWQSSNLDRPNHKIFLEDDDGKNRLVVIEGEYDKPWVRQVGVWAWNGWGFTKIAGQD